METTIEWYILKTKKSIDNFYDENMCVWNCIQQYESHK